jgi:hypothetical protein
MNPHTGKAVFTEVAPCGLMCTRCESFTAGKCKGCYTENSQSKKQCPVLTDTPFKESERLVLCMREKRVKKCINCRHYPQCEIYENMLIRCPFKRPVFELKPGFAYLVKERKADQGLRIFSDLVRHGATGLCISRQHPKTLEKVTGRGNTEIFWLTSLDGKNNIDPTDIGILSDIIIRYIEQHKGGVLYLDGLELLITHNDFPKILRMVNHIIEQVMHHSARFVVSMDERTLDSKELALLERDMEIVARKD